MKKRIFSMLLAVSVLSTTFVTNTVLVSAEGEDILPAEYKGFNYEHQVKAEPLYMIDFETTEDEEKDDNAPAIKYRNGVSLSYGEGYNGGTALQTTGATSFYLPLAEPLTTGQYLLSFDYKQNINSAEYMYMRWNWDNGINTYFSVKDSKIGQVINWSYQGNPYTADEWVHVNLFIDFDRGTMDYYFNNEHYTQRTGVVDLTNDIIITGSSEKGLVRSYDNFAMYPFTNELRLELREMGMAMPSVFYDDFDVNLSSKYVGNAFTESSDISMNLDIVNKADEKVKYDVEYTVQNYYWQTVDSGKIENCTIAGEGTATHTIIPKVDKYDIYTLFVTIKPDFEGAEPVEIDREFSLVNTPTLGYKSPYFGTCTHPGRGRTAWSEIERLFNMSGIGYTRTDGGWGGIERTKGSYETGPAFEAEANGFAQIYSPNFYGDRAAEGTENVLIFTPDNGLYNNLAPGASSYERIANSPEALEALEKAAEATARIYKGRINNFELGNELNFQRVENMSPETYVKVCQAAYKGFKKGNPDCFVLSQGHSRAVGDLTYRYLMAVKNNGGGKPFDGIAIHPYVGQGYPEITMWEDNVKWTTESIERAGYTRDDYEVWVTEGNMSTHTSYGTNQQHANALIRQYVLVQAFKVVDKYFMYQLQVQETNGNDNEHWFGCLQGRTTKNANAPRKTYLAICNYNAMTENAEVTKTYRMDGPYDRDTVFAQFKKPNGNYTTIMYTTNNCKNVTVDFGATDGTIYDIDGNATKVSSPDGKYTFTLTDTPMYFEVASDKLEVSESVEITRDKEMIELGEGDFDTYKVTLPEGSTLELVGTENMDLEQSQSQNIATVKVTARELPKFITYTGIGNKAGMFTEHRMHDGTQVYRDYIYAYVKKDGVTTDMILLPVEYAYEAADVTFLVKPYDNTNTKYWKGVIEVRNNKSTPISGTIKLTEPESLAKLDPIKVPELAPYETRKFTFAMPIEATTGWITRGGVLTLSNGEEIPFYMGDTPGSKHYAKPGGTLVMKSINKIGDEGEPKLDGVLDAEEWQKYKICDFDKSQVSYGNQGNIIDGVVERDTFNKDDDYGGKEDFSGSIYAKWDDDFLYVASIVYDDVHWAKQDVRSFYYDDVFYVGGKQSNTQRHDSRIDMALSEYHQNEVFDESEKHGIMWCNYTPTLYGRNAEIISGKEGADCYIVRKDTVTIYEAKIPWQHLVTEEALARRQCYLFFSHRDYDGDRDKTNSWSGWFYLADHQD